MDTFDFTAMAPCLRYANIPRAERRARLLALEIIGHAGQELALADDSHLGLLFQPASGKEHGQHAFSMAWRRQVTDTPLQPFTPWRNGVMSRLIRQALDHDLVDSISGWLKMQSQYRALTRLDFPRDDMGARLRDVVGAEAWTLWERCQLRDVTEAGAARGGRRERMRV